MSSNYIFLAAVKGTWLSFEQCICLLVNIFFGRQTSLIFYNNLQVQFCLALNTDAMYVTKFFCRRFILISYKLNCFRHWSLAFKRNWLARCVVIYYVHGNSFQSLDFWGVLINFFCQIPLSLICCIYSLFLACCSIYLFLKSVIKLSILTLALYVYFLL